MERDAGGVFFAGGVVAAGLVRSGDQVVLKRETPVRIEPASCISRNTQVILRTCSSLSHWPR